MREFSVRALMLGLVMCVVLGAANAYLGLRAGMTIAATYPAAVIGMAVLRLAGGTLLEENFARTVGSIGEAIAGGVVFTIPAFVILRLWTFNTPRDYLTASGLMIVGGVLGILFVTMLRRVMVEDPTLPFPESVAAAEIHKAGQRGTEAAWQLFRAMGVGAAVQMLAMLQVFSASNTVQVGIGTVRKSIVRLGFAGTADALPAGGVTSLSAPAVSPAYIGVGYIIGPELAALNFAGGALCWGFLVPLLVFLLGPSMIDRYLVAAGGEQAAAWAALTAALYQFVARPIAVGGMLVGACYTLFRMRRNLVAGLRRAGADARNAAKVPGASLPAQRDLSLKIVLPGLAGVLLLMAALYAAFTGSIGVGGLVAVVMLVVGFLFAAVSGNLVGTIGSSNNPLSGLALATTILSALLLVTFGASGTTGVAAVLGIAAIVSISSAVAGEMLQDLKVGHILGGTPWKMQVGDLVGVVAAGLLLFFPIWVLHSADLKLNPTGGGLGGPALPAPQASLIAALAQGIVGGEMAWPLVLVGVALGLALIMIKVRSPMLFAVGMYLPFGTTSAIFVGGLIRWVVDRRMGARRCDTAQRARVENAGVLAASGLIAGEALTSLLVACVVFLRGGFWQVSWPAAAPLAIVFGGLIAAYLVLVPLRKAGAPDAQVETGGLR